MREVDPPEMSIDADLRLAEALADAARAIATAHFRHGPGFDVKADRTPVTVADEAIERAFRAAIAAETPADGVLGEEQGAEGLDRRRVWVLDPIDGTGAFLCGSPLFGSLIGLLEDGAPVLGVVEIPALGERWTAARGRGARFGDAPARVGGCGRLAEARIGCTSPLRYGPAERAAFERLAAGAFLTRLGGDCYAYGLLASGHLDAVVEAGLQPYDYLPIAPIVAEAGGVMTDWRGEPLSLASDGRVVAAATPALHAEIVATLAA